jgi:hypothetical protein
MEIQADPNGLERFFVIAPEFAAEFKVCGRCPVQALGAVLKRAIYFRARHNEWSFDVADCSGNLPSDGFRDSDGFYRDGKYVGNCEMPLREAIKVVVKCLREFTGVDS